MSARYLFVNENFGGHATVHRSLAAIFAGSPGIDVDIIDVPRAEGARRLWSAGIPGLDRIDADLKPLRHQLGVSAWVRRQLDPVADGYDALHLYSQNTALLSTSVMRRIPTVVTSDATNSLNAYRIEGRQPSALTPANIKIAAIWDRRVYTHAAALIANSELVATSLVNDYGVHRDKVRVIPVGIMVPDLPEPDRARRRPRIVYVGRSMERKGGNLLLDLHQAWWRDHADLVLVTQSRVPAAPGVHVISDLTPGDSRLWTVLLESDIFVLPSSADLSPNAVFEAMAAYLPVVAYRVSALPEMVTDGTTGVLVDEGDVGGVRWAVDRLLHDVELRRRMGWAGRQRVSKEFDIRDRAQDLLGVLDTVRIRR